MSTPLDEGAGNIFSASVIDSIQAYHQRLVARSATDRNIIWLDFTDFSHYVENGNVTVSGIQRVVANLVDHAGVSSYQVIPVILDRDARAVYAADAKLLIQLIALLQFGGAEREELIKLERTVRESRFLVQPRAGDVFVMAGAFWIYESYDLFAKLRRQGVKLVLFVHDLIQISAPEYVSSDVNTQFRKALLDMLAVVTLILTNSYYVRDEVQRFIRSRLGMQMLVTAVQLPTELPSKSVLAHSVPDAVKNVAKGDYVLCVTTIEIRKNHLFLVKIWEQLLREGGIAVPKLVFVGKWGWRVEELRAYLESSGALGSWLLVFNDLSDVSLSHLYEHALFTAYPSFAEGWGLPVGESLAHGKPCVASNTTSIPEVGGDLVRYVDPYDVDAGYAVICSLLLNRDEITRWSQRIVNQFRPKTWDAYCSEFYNCVDAHVADLEIWPVQGNYQFAPGRLYVMGHADLAQIDHTGGALISARMNRDDGWQAVGEWGVWASSAEASLALRTPLAAGTEVTVYLHLCRSEGDRPVKAYFESGGHLTSLGELQEVAALFSARGRVQAEGILSMTIRSDVGTMGGDYSAVPPAAGLKAVGFCVPDDLSSRLDVYEASGRLLSHRQAGGSGMLHETRMINELYASNFFVPRLLAGGVGRARGWPLPWTCWQAAVDLRAARRAARRCAWGKAEARYARLLRKNWTQPKLWIQYAHAIKEQGDYRSALSAYLIALQLDPANRELSAHVEFCRSMRRVN